MHIDPSCRISALNIFTGCYQLEQLDFPMSIVEDEKRTSYLFGCSELIQSAVTHVCVNCVHASV